jgi:antitoxin CptB
MDLIMGRFAEAVIGAMTEVEMAELERLGDVPDPDLYAWITGARPVPSEYNTGMLRRLREFHFSRSAQ